MSSPHQVFLGTSTAHPSQSRGIYAAQFDPGAGVLMAPKLAASIANPTFLALNPSGDFLYALSEQGQGRGKPGGALAAFIVPPDASSELKFLGGEPTGGGILTHVAVDATGQMAVVVSYSAGEIGAFPLSSDGRPGPCTGLIKPTGQLGPKTKRQDRPHPHSATISPDNRHVYVCDLALDKIFCFRLHLPDATLVPAGEFCTPAGSGPRHAKFSADGRFFYVINELDSTISVYGCDATTGELTQLQNISTLPSDFQGESYCAEICLSADERFVYGSNRGHDSLAVFSRHAATGELTPIEITPCGGKHPRSFALSPDGMWLLCANRDSNHVVLFQVEIESGRLRRADAAPISVPQAICVLFRPVP